MSVFGSFPFGAPLRSLAQIDRGPKRVFVLGVYASAVHARWFGADGKLLVQALAVASEPVIFWDGSGAGELVASIRMPDSGGRLEPATARFNGPSGRSLDRDFLEPLGLGRTSSWLCDLVPHACLNESQRDAIDRAYQPRTEALGLSAVDLPVVPSCFADDARRAEILAEVAEAKPDMILLLGDQPIAHWLRHYYGRWARLSDFGEDPATYGRLHTSTIGGRRYEILPLAHPRQVGGLGRHSPKWRALHTDWKQGIAGELLG